MQKNKYLKIVLWFLSVALVPLGISLVANLVTWYKTKDNVEITLRLEGWITIGSVEFNDLPNLKLFLDSEEVSDILKVSWRIINTGNKGIEKFESGPFIEFPNDLNIVSARIDEASPFLKVAKQPIISDNRILIDSLGILNSTDNMKIDIYLKNMSKQNIDSYFFNKWELKGKTLNLNIKKDIPNMKSQVKLFSFVELVISIIGFSAALLGLMTAVIALKTAKIKVGVK